MDPWFHIGSAPKISGEFIGTRWGWSETLQKMVCIREPFISFWSPTLNKFYCDPTHWAPLPRTPEKPEEA